MQIPPEVLQGFYKAADMNNNLLELKKVFFKYHVKWNLEDINLFFEPSKLIGIIGPNGSGKSTLVKIAAGLIKPNSGDIILNGNINLNKLSRKEVARIIGYLPQSVEVPFNYTASEIVETGRFPHIQGAGFFSAKDRAAVQKSMALTQTLTFSSRPLNTLSGGERQRVMLASVIAQEASIMLLDEPTSAMDIHQQTGIFKMLKNLTRKGICIAVVTHDLNLASLFSDKIVVLKAGQVEACGKPEDILTIDLLKHVYGEGITVIKHPECNSVMVLPVLHDERKQQC